MTRDQHLQTDTEIRTVKDAFKAEALASRVTLGELRTALREGAEDMLRAAGRFQGLTELDLAPESRIRVEGYAEHCRDSASRMLVAVGVRRGK